MILTEVFIKGTKSVGDFVLVEDKSPGVVCLGCIFYAIQQNEKVAIECE